MNINMSVKFWKRKPIRAVDKELLLVQEWYINFFKNKYRTYVCIITVHFSESYSSNLSVSHVVQETLLTDANPSQFYNILVFLSKTFNINKVTSP